MFARSFRRSLKGMLKRHIVADWNTSKTLPVTVSSMKSFPLSKSLQLKLPGISLQA